MTSIRLGMTLLGIAALAATAIVVHQARAADTAGIMKIVLAIKAGKDADAKSAAKAYADAALKEKLGVDDLMDGFGKKALVADGIQKKLSDFTKAVGPDDLANDKYKDIGVLVAAVGMVCEALPAPQGGNIKGTPKEWIAFSKDVKAKGAAFQAAFQTKKAPDVKAAAKALDTSCINCHMKFNP